MSFLFKPRQIVIMDSQSSGPARNFRIRFITLLSIIFATLLAAFTLGAWYSPFHSAQEIIPENIKLKRQNIEMRREIADATTTSALKDEQMNSLKEQLSLQESEIVNVNKQLHMYKSILDERKGKGIHVLESKAWLAQGNRIKWSSLFVKGGSYPRYLSGKYKLSALDDEGNRKDLNISLVKYKIESHIFLKDTFEWGETWVPSKLELIVYNSRLKEVLRKIIVLKRN